MHDRAFRLFIRSWSGNHSTSVLRFPNSRYGDCGFLLRLANSHNISRSWTFSVPTTDPCRSSQPIAACQCVPTPSLRCHAVGCVKPRSRIIMTWTYKQFSSRRGPNELDGWDTLSIKSSKKYTKNIQWIIHFYSIRDIHTGLLYFELRAKK